MSKTHNNLPFHGYALSLPTVADLRRIKLSRIKSNLSHNSLVVKKVWRLPLVVFIPIAGLAVFVAFTATAFFFPRSVSYSYGSETCLFNPQFLPNHTSPLSNNNYTASVKSPFRMFGYPVFASETCITPVSAPLERQKVVIKLAPLNLPLLQKSITITTPEAPSIVKSSLPTESVGTNATLNFLLDKHDNTFEYSISSNNKTADCQKEYRSVICPLSELKLAAGKTYAYSLNRLFDNADAGVVSEDNLTTLNPVIIKSSSISMESTVYSKPSSIELTSNKSISHIDNISLEATESPDLNLFKDYKITESKITINFRELPREKQFKLTIGHILATDGSNLIGPYELTFTTSGGPKVTTSSIASYGVSPYADFSLNFDVGLAPGQNISKFITVSKANEIVPATVSASGNQIYINPSVALGACTDFSVSLKAGLVSQYDVGNGSAWQINSRTICRQSYSIGTSVLGRSITAYRFGNGASKIVYIAGMHGNEYSGTSTLNGWIDYLERKYREIPAHRTIIVIPIANPDGYAAGQRNNAHDIDLNRNFPSNDWISDAQGPGGATVPGSGGASPLDQPESAAIASYIQSVSPRFVLSYHATAGYVISNDAGDSISLGSQYASRTGYAFTTDAGTDSVFDYATTGEFEDWLVNKLNIPGILIELTSNYGNHIGRHGDAMWQIATM